MRKTSEELQQIMQKHNVDRDNIYKLKQLEKKRKRYIGKTKENLQGCLMKIIEYNNDNDIIVEFQDKYKYKVKTTYNTFQSRSIKNRFYPSVQGVGIIGEKHRGNLRKNKKFSIEYSIWTSMLERATNNDFKNKNLSYIDCEVCNEWLLYDSFYDWIHGQDNFFKYNEIKLYLDKDILIKNNKLYSPDTCCLVPKRVNQIFVKSNLSRGKYPIGVGKLNNKYRAYCSVNGKTIHLGCFSTIDEAFNTYKVFKENYIKKVAEEEYSQGNIIKKCYDAMMKYEVEIDD